MFPPSHQAKRGALLNIKDSQELDTYPKLGAFWEGFALEEVIRAHNAINEECFFWATHADAELDLFIIRHGKRYGFEFKYTDRPKITKSMKIALNDLQLDHLYVIHPNNISFPLDEKILKRYL